MIYTPKNEREYGTLACWAKNSIGKQTEPCLFQVVPAGNLFSFLPSIPVVVVVVVVLGGAGVAVFARELFRIGLESHVHFFKKKHSNESTQRKEEKETLFRQCMPFVTFYLRK